MRGAWLLVMVAGCLTPDGFARRFTRVDCERVWECDPVAASMVYDLECEGMTDQVRATGDCMEQHCTFDPDAARSCTDDLEAAGCEGITSGEAYGRCRDVWVDCDGEQAACAG